MPKLLGVDTSGTTVGTMKDFSGLVAPTAYLLVDGRTIGSAASAATSRANADTLPLYTLLWDNFADAQLPVSGGRGASAAADFAANKTITLPDLRGRGTVGKDDMGGSAANRITGAGSGITGTTLGAAGGTETHVLSLAQMPAHGHAVKNANGGVTEPQNGTAQGFAALNTATPGYTTNAAAAGLPYIESTGSGTAHQNTQPSYVITKIIAYK